ncbi:DUF3288 family protein [Synechococcus sp. RSCCF101]|uniref:DUF3288 family protein n=1 Tax=Synechococcus sp. RSCCF101 TaxID=2511069 RepID=UPI0012452C9F|nr:DUF3288 family protein [Synechococcus sp. RSCCF101]QEY31488.1 DUF3288 family protein [Synechococcus sp. RSCCF101]
MSDEQNHPLYEQDRAITDRLLAAAEPGSDDVVDLARLLIRYDGFPGAADIRDDLSKALRLWGLSRQELNGRARALWESGHRPGSGQQEAVGSGFDTADQTGP